MQNPLVPVSLDVLLGFMVFLLLVIIAVLWFVNRQEKSNRKKFLDQFDPSQLRMSANQIGIVFRVLNEGDEKTTVIPIWKGKREIRNGSELQILSKTLIPFDPSRFF